MFAVPRRPSLAILIANTAVSPLALNIFVPSMPALQEEFGVEYGTVQLTLTLYLAGIAVAQLAYGPLSDRFGRRSPMLFGLVLFLAGSILCLLAPNIETLIAGRLVQAVGGCSGIVLGRAIVRDLYDREGAARMLAYITAAMVVAPMVAPAIGGVLHIWFGWQAGFLFVLLFGAAVLAATLRSLPETHLERSPWTGLAALAVEAGRLIGHRAFLGHAFQISFSSAMFYSFLSGGPYVMVELMERTPAEYGIYFMALSVTFMAGNFTSGRISATVGGDRVILFGLASQIAGATALAGFTAFGLLTPASLFGSMAAVSFGNGLCLPNGIAGAVSVDPRKAGTAAGLSGFLQMAVGAGCAYLVGALMTDSAFPMVAVVSSAAILAAIAHVLGVMATATTPEAPAGGSTTKGRK